MNGKKIKEGKEPEYNVVVRVGPKENSKLIRVGGAWINKAKNGTEYLAIRFPTFFLFERKRREG